MGLVTSTQRLTLQVEGYSKLIIESCTINIDLPVLIGGLWSNGSQL
ncbi:hypothetical protein QWZ13_14375 [Reinekea marina]|nr:hypothetical protein [Reinekea marina]MDN3650102.1 hypothetical protein [Reinekea marina]